MHLVKNFCMQKLSPPLHFKSNNNMFHIIFSYFFYNEIKDPNPTIRLPFHLISCFFRWWFQLVVTTNPKVANHECKFII
jgi:hypothetical protein